MDSSSFLVSDRIVQTILDYVYDKLVDVSPFWPREEFEERAYSRWAAIEILNLIMDHPQQSVFQTIDAFYIKMCHYARIGRSTMFQIAAETAEEITRLLV